MPGLQVNVQMEGEVLVMMCRGEVDVMEMCTIMLHIKDTPPPCAH